MDRYSVTGMSCAACQARVEKAVSAVPGVTSCAVSLLTNSMSVEGSASAEEIISAVEKAGYGAAKRGAGARRAVGAAEEAAEMLKDTETPKLRRRLILSVAFLVILMYVTMGHNMWGWPLPKYFEHNHIALGILQLLLAAAVMVINQKFFVNGYKVGVVQSIDYDYARPDQIMASVGLDEKLVLPKGTVAEIDRDLLGNVRLELRLGDVLSGKMVAGDTIIGQTVSGLMDKAATMVPQIEMMLPKLDSILASVNALLADPTISNSMHNVENITARLTTTTQQLHQLTASLNHQLPGIMSKADGVMANADTLTRSLNTLDVASTMAKVDQTMRNVEQLTARLNSNDGTLGLLMRDPGLYNNLNATMKHADSLMIDLKSHPKRYVHFSVFGKKDK